MMQFDTLKGTPSWSVDAVGEKSSNFLGKQSYERRP